MKLYMYNNIYYDRFILYLSYWKEEKLKNYTMLLIQNRVTLTLNITQDYDKIFEEKTFLFKHYITLGDLYLFSHLWEKIVNHYLILNRKKEFIGTMEK